MSATQNNEAPIGYVTPEFPSLHWPLGASKMKYNRAFLYYTEDVWKFCVFWSLIMMIGFYMAATVIAILTHYRGTSYNLYMKGARRINDERQADDNTEVAKFARSESRSLISRMVTSNKKYLPLVVVVYIIVGAFEGFVAGSLIGVLVSAIYNSGQFKMTTWLPFVYSLIVALFNVISSYSLTSTLM
ncbi:DEKNAAC101841 [Brettanomyces naardenensis]|uniref:DEKNAAC101842 n=1 Tax=Brettanomyces naardenensis TaxID=13370 RepID=A0A448YJC9_BRENA|nr:DEKNAAC101841 [Brettanomyces naardenensis]